MSDHAAWLIFWGLLLNGCLQSGPARIEARDIVNEAAIVQGLEKAGCYASGRDWAAVSCREARK